MMEQVRRAALLQRLRQRLGATPRERLTWLLDFAYRRGVERLSEPERYGLWRELLQVIADAPQGPVPLVPEWGKRKKPLRLGTPEGEAEAENVVYTDYEITAEALREAQREVRIAVEAVTAGHLYHRPFSVGAIARLGPKQLPAPPTPRARFVLDRQFLAPLPYAAAMAALALMAEIPPTLLRRCPYRPNPTLSTECGRAFVGVKRQKWCLEHQEAARRERDRLAQQNHRQRLDARRRRGRARKGGRR